VLFTLNLKGQRKRPVKRKIYLRKRADQNTIKEQLRKFADYFESSLIQESIETKWNEFVKGIQQIMNSCIPHKLSSSRYHLPWFNRSLRRKARLKQRLYNTAKLTGNKSHWAKFRACRKQMHQDLKSARETYYSDFFEHTIEENPKRFWTHIKQLSNDNHGVADLKIGDEIINDERRKSNILNQQFTIVFTKENLENIPDVGKDPKPNISHLQITIKGVVKQLCSLKPHKACGPDEIPPWFLKENSNEIAPMLTNIFQDSIDAGVLPSQWKKTNICAVFKKGSRSDPANYRPISLTCVACKILEHIVHSFVMKHLDKHSILTDLQHGFRAKRSTVSQLILTINDIAKSIDNRNSVHAAVLDFSKAFDKVPHRRLLKKLEYYGIGDSLLKWFGSFLTMRQQSVICSGESSQSSHVTSGVPQRQF
jgi:hypothetical protein